VHVVVGLGNPGPRYEDTRHNIGQRVLDVLAQRLRATWHRHGPAILSQGRWGGTTIDLVKPTTFMNSMGPAVASVLHHLQACPGDLVLVYDDLDLPLGTVRTRIKGSHGGHNGVRSVLETLGTQDVRRVKVGIGRPPHREDIVDWVLTPFEAEERDTVDQAVEQAADRVLALVETPSPS
jgi:PTH1 family peptidyl-tRNA hydrolase